MPPGNFGIKLLCDGTDKLRILHRHNNGIAEILVPLYVCRNADGMNGVRHAPFNAAAPRFLILRSRGRGGSGFGRCADGTKTLAKG